MTQEQQVNQERRRAWLKALRNFKLSMQVLAKLGVIEEVCKQVHADRQGSYQWSAPDWDHERWVAALYECIRDGTLPKDIVRAFAQTAEVTFLTQKTQPTTKAVLDAVDFVCRRKSQELRRLFGVTQ